MSRSARLNFLLFKNLDNDKQLQQLNMRERLFDLLTRGQYGTVNLFCQKKNSPKQLLLLIHVAPIKNENGEIVLFLFNIREISLEDQGRKRSQQSDPHGFAKRSIHQKVRTIRKKVSEVKSSLKPTDMPCSKVIKAAVKRKNFVIYHYGKFKLVWGWFILLLTIYTAISVPMVVCFDHPELHDKHIHKNRILWLIVDSFVDIIFIADVAINFVTTIVGAGGEVVSDPLIIRMNYISTWFTLDLLSCLPYDIFNMIINRETSEEGITTLFQALKVARLLRLGRVARKLDHYAEYSGVMLMLLVGVFALSGHWLACLWYKTGYDGMIAIHNNNPLNATLVHYNWLVKLGRDINEPFTLTENYDSHGKQIGMRVAGGPSVNNCYLTSFYFTLSSLTSVGFGNVSPNTTGEKLVSIMMFMFGALLYATIFGNVTTIITQMYADTNRYHDMLSSVREFLRIYQIPQGLRLRIMHYIISTWNMTKGIDTTRVLNYFPKDMRADICVHLRDVEA